MERDGFSPVPHPAENCKRENSQEDISPSAKAESGVSFFYILIRKYTT
jgi:hypothetical protein